MIRKLILGGVGAAFLGAICFGTEAGSYLRTGASQVRKAVKAEVPVEFEIARARTMVEQLVPDMRRCMQVIAEQQVDVANLKSTIAERVANITRQENAVLALRGDLKTGSDTFRYAGRSFSSHDVQRDLTVRFERMKTAKMSLAADEKVLAAREQTLAANQEKLATLVQAKQELEVKLEQLQARVETVRAAEAATHLVVDDSNLSRARQLISGLNRQLDVQEKLIEQTGKLTGSIPVDEPAPAQNAQELGDQIDAYFRDSGRPTTEVAAAPAT